jgi:hypothetical protein
LLKGDIEEESLRVVPEGIVSVDPGCTAANPVTTHVLVPGFHVPFRVTSGPFRPQVDEPRMTLVAAPAGKTATPMPNVVAAHSARTEIRTRRIRVHPALSF